MYKETFYLFVRIMLHSNPLNKKELITSKRKGEIRISKSNILISMEIIEILCFNHSSRLGHLSPVVQK